MTITFEHKQNFSRLEVKNVEHMYSTGVECTETHAEGRDHNDMCGGMVGDFKFIEGKPKPFKYFDVKGDDYRVINVTEDKA